LIKNSTEFKVGIFAVAVIALLAWATVRVGDKTAVHGRGYKLKVVFSNATGLKLKAPVELAGVDVGVVKDIELLDSREALVTLVLSDKVKLPDDSSAILRTRGFLGETYVEIVPGTTGKPVLQKDSQIPYASRTGDINSLVDQFNQIAEDIKHVTGSLRTMVGDDETAPINRIVNNLDEFTKSIRDLTVRNSENVDRVSANLADMTEQLREIVASGRQNVEESMERIASISRKIDEGKGTVGRLVNDEETVDKLNEAVDNLNQALGGYKRLEAEIGYHMEYLGRSNDFKNYVDLTLKPSPDKAFMIGVVSDPNPNPSHTVRTTDVTVGNNTTQVVTDTGTIERNRLRWSAQLAKTFYDFTVRGGLIESTGGVGLDYNRGPVGLQFSAFDFQTRYGERPHLKLLADIDITRNFYILGGADDFIAKGDRPDWFLGAGFRFVDEDIKSVGRMGGSLVK
jgi:phospholipid/cholesterol/gamma-HCH transport system substrate-binding protein